MTLEPILALGIWALTLAAWPAAIILVRAAYGAHIGALTERAIVAVGLALFGTAYSFVVVNAELAPILDTRALVILVRVGVVGLLLLPLIWTGFYWLGRLGDNGDGGP